MSGDVEFAQGFYFNEPQGNAPDFVLGKVSIQRDKFMDWLVAQQPNEKGYVRIDVKRSRSGSVYASLDTWQPSGEKPLASGSPHDRQRNAGGPTLPADDLDDNIPFLSHERGWLV